MTGVVALDCRTQSSPPFTWIRLRLLPPQEHCGIEAHNTHPQSIYLVPEHTWFSATTSPLSSKAALGIARRRLEDDSPRAGRPRVKVWVMWRLSPRTESIHWQWKMTTGVLKSISDCILHDEPESNQPLFCTLPNALYIAAHVRLFGSK